MAVELQSCTLLFVSAASYSSLSPSQRQTAGPRPIKNCDGRTIKNSVEERGVERLFLMEVIVDQITRAEHQGKTTQKTSMDPQSSVVLFPLNTSSKFLQDAVFSLLFFLLSQNSSVCSSM